MGQLAKSPSPILTIGMAVHDDHRGVWFTCQNIRRYLRKHHPECLSQIEFLILDNNPRSAFGAEVREYASGKFKQRAANVPPVCHYISTGDYKSTSLRNAIFQFASTEWVMCIDSHVFVDGIPELLRFLRHCAFGSNDLFHGMLVNEFGDLLATHMNPAFRGGNFGTWGAMQPPEGKKWSEIVDPFEVPLHGMGLFVARRDAWPGWHIGMRSFGGEEGYTQEQYRLLGRKVFTLPFLTWEHQFNHPGGTSYPNSAAEKLRNMHITWREVGLPVELAMEYFKSAMKSPEYVNAVAAAQSVPVRPYAIPSGYVPFCGYPIRINDRLPESRRESENYREFEKLVFA